MSWLGEDFAVVDSGYNRQCRNNLQKWRWRRVGWCSEFQVKRMAILGPANYVAHSGSRPISFIWELESPMPASIIRYAMRMAI